jgi:hypothetical protein
LVELIGARLPLSPPLFAPDVLTDRDEPFHAAEIVREKLTLKLREELPYGINVQIERFADEDGRIMINAVIWVERAGQKAIVIGRAASGSRRSAGSRASNSTICGSARCISSYGSRSRKTGRTARWHCANSGTTRCEQHRPAIRAARMADAGYVLHQYAYRDTSRIVEAFTAEHGRLTLFARGATGPKSSLARRAAAFPAAAAVLVGPVRGLPAG